MRRVVVIGANSYIGRSFYSYAAGSMQVALVSSRGGVWKGYDFSGVDSVVYAAGIAHRKQTRENLNLYFAVNTELAVEVAEHVKQAGVRQFVYLSSVSVYGKETGVIAADAVPAPKKNDAYGMSKFQAEQRLHAFQDETFDVLILRPPMVYGPDCRGNFAKLKKLVTVMPVFPDVCNQRSMIYIENLCEGIRQGIEERWSGIFLLQDPEYVNTTVLARLIAENLGVPFHASRLLGWVVIGLSPISVMLRKAFGSLVFQKKTSGAEPYQQFRLEEAVARSVGKIDENLDL